MSSNSYKLILVVSDLSNSEIPSHIKEMLSSAKLNYVICLGNVGNKSNVNYLKSLSNNFHIVYGDKDEFDDNLKEVEILKIDSFTIGIINGFQVVPWGDLYCLSSIRSKYNCDISTMSRSISTIITSSTVLCFRTSRNVAPSPPPMSRMPATRSAMAPIRSTSRLRAACPWW